MCGLFSLDISIVAAKVKNPPREDSTLAYI